MEAATQLRADPEAPKAARWFLWSVAARKTLPADMETATLLVSEVVSNAVRYGDPEAPISLTCRIEGESLRATVRNQGPRFGGEADRRPGYGLRLVATLSRRSGARATGDGMEVWFEV